MAKLEDTDPSSPEAIRGQASTEPAAPPGAPQVSTDPGIGPPSRPPIPATFMQTQRMLPVPARPLNIVVPASSAVQPKKDSVELLLDGMAGPQLDRPKTTPQSDGQAAASYHAQHGVRPAHTSPDLEPKVVVERPALPKTMKVDRAVVQQAIEMADARRRAQDATVVAPQRVAPRVIVAIVAGLVVVLGLFVVARLIVMRSGTTAATPTRPAVVTVVATATATAPATASAVATAAAPAPASETAAAPASATASGTASASAAPIASAPAPASSVPWWARPKTKPTTGGAPAGTATGSDLGEFKTTFH
jgi:hypothetical protein